MTLMDNHLLPIQTINETPVIDSRLVAKALGIQHKSFMETIHKYQSEIEAFSSLPFQTEVKKKKVGATREKFCYLSEDQAIFMGTLSRNTQRVVAFKVNLVKAFAQARKNIEEALSPAQVTLKLAQQMVDFEQRIKVIEEDKQKAKKELLKIQQEGSHALYSDHRKRLDHLVKSYAEYKKAPVPKIYQVLYKEFDLVYGKKIYYHAEKTRKTPIAWLESQGWIVEAYELAKRLFVIPPQYYE